MSIIGATTIAWDDAHKRGVIMWKVPRNIRLNDNIVVREDEYAVFYRDGKAIAYIDRPDRYALTSINAPIVGRIVQLLSGVKQQAEVYYVQKRPFDGKFGSKQPYQFRDKEFGIVNLRVFGEFRYRVISCENFINQFVGTLNYTTHGEVDGRIKEQMVVLVYDAIGELKEKGLGVADLAANLEEIEQVVLARSKKHFEMYGLEVQKISGLYISMPEEVQKAVDARASMTILGTDYMGYQAGQAMRDAARNPSGGAAGAGVGIGAGLGMGYVMIDQMGRRAPAPAPGAAAGGGATCVSCGKVIAPGTKFCPHCGAPQEEGKKCIKCGAFIEKDAKFCPKCGASQVKKCIKCGEEIAPDAKFCPKCGAKQEETMKCPKCGAEVGSGAKFCPKCGESLE